MNKRMRKFLVSLGMVVVLGSGNVFADNTMVTSELATYLKSVMDPADDYAVFANKLTTSAHIDGSIAANDATITNTSIGNSNAKGNNTSYIVKLNEATNQSDLFMSGHSAALDMNKNTIVLDEHKTTYEWVKSNGSRLKLAAKKYVQGTAEDGLKLYKITENGLGKDSKITIDSALETLRTLSTDLTTKLGDGAVKIVNVDVSKLQKSSGTGNEADYFDITLENTDGDNNLGVAVVNVKVPSNLTSVTVDRALRVNGKVIDNYNELAGKVLFNFVSDDGTSVTPYNKALTFNMGAGIVLAPSATVNVSTGNHDGAIICNIFAGNSAQMHQVEFNLTDKNDKPSNGSSDGFDDFNNGEETGDTLRYGAMAVVGLAAAGLAIVNKKGKDEE